MHTDSRKKSNCRHGWQRNYNIGAGVRYIVTAIMFATLTAAAAQAAMAQASSAAVPPPAIDVPVRIPFLLYNSGAIVFDAQINGRTIQSRLDTGAATMSFTNTLQIAGEHYSRYGFLHLYKIHLEDEDNDRVRSLTIPAIRLGTYEVNNLVGNEVLNGDPPADISVDDAFWRRLANVTPTLLKDRVVTINYEHRELEIYPAGYDPAIRTAATFGSEPAAASSEKPRMLTFEMDNSERNVSIGCPVVDATVDGIPARVLIDTAWGDATVGIGPDLYKKIVAKRESGGDGLKAIQFGSDAQGTDAKPMEGLADVTTTIQFPGATASPYQITTDGEKTWSWGSKTDAIVGWAFLRHFRSVTFDFAHDKLYLDPWTPGSPQDRTGIFANSSLATASTRRDMALKSGVPQPEWDTDFGTVNGAAAPPDGAAVHAKPITFNGLTGDLWDDGTFIPTAWPSQLQQPQTAGPFVLINQATATQTSAAQSTMVQTSATPVTAAAAMPPTQPQSAASPGYVWRLYSKGGWTQVPVPTAPAAGTAVDSAPPCQAPNETHWKLFSGIGFAAVPDDMLASGVQAPVVAAPVGTYWRNYATTGWALLPIQP